MKAWRHVCSIRDLRPDRGAVVEIDGLAVAVFLVEGKVFAIDARCPHAAGPLGRGWIEAGEVVCPLHRWRFRLADGVCTTVDGQAVSTYGCELRDGEVWIEIEDFGDPITTRPSAAP